MKPTELEMSRIKRTSEEKDVRAIIARNFSARRMSNTRWRQALWSLEDIPCKRRIKFVDVQEPLNGSVWPATQTYCDSNWGPVSTVSLEWFEIETIQEVPHGLLLKPERIDHSAEIERRLQEIHVPYAWVEGHVRIVGYVRNQPNKTSE